MRRVIETHLVTGYGLLAQQVCLAEAGSDDVRLAPACLLRQVRWAVMDAPQDIRARCLRWGDGKLRVGFGTSGTPEITRGCGGYAVNNTRSYLGEMYRLLSRVHRLLIIALQPTAV